MGIIGKILEFFLGDGDWKIEPVSSTFMKQEART